VTEYACGDGCHSNQFKCDIYQSAISPLPAYS
jgi:hypothetical protein